VVHSVALGSFKPTSRLRANQWDLTLGASARSFQLLVREALPLLEGRDSHVVTISSLGSSRVIPNYGAIGVAKAALESLTRYLAFELAPRGVHVNAVSAGLVDTVSVRIHPQYDALARDTVARTPAGRIGTAGDIANVVLFLCSPESNWIVGQTIVADGGLSLAL
jgi:enoyl-[acyl-carrier protein] reductase III